MRQQFLWFKTFQMFFINASSSQTRTSWGIKKIIAVKGCHFERAEVRSEEKSPGQRVLTEEISHANTQAPQRFERAV